MHWLNEPEEWGDNAQKLNLKVDPGTDYWRVTHYGFIRDSGPFYYQEATGNFEATVKLTGNYQELFHQAGLMVRIDNKNWIKTGTEYVDGVQNVSAWLPAKYRIGRWCPVTTAQNPSGLKCSAKAIMCR